ncbi:MAG: hypothetical protein ACYS8Z_12895 [Planctomycetota bacterium]
MSRLYFSIGALAMTIVAALGLSGCATQDETLVEVAVVDSTTNKAYIYEVQGSDATFTAVARGPIKTSKTCEKADAEKAGGKMDCPGGADGDCEDVYPKCQPPKAVGCRCSFYPDENKYYVIAWCDNCPDDSMLPESTPIITLGIGD